MLKITPALIDAFIKNLTEQEYSPATISKYAHDARALMEYAPDGITDKMQLVGFRSWLEQRGYSGASVNSMLGAVNALLVYIGTDWRLKYVRVQRRAFLPPDRELSLTEYERMVHTAEHQGDRRLALLVQTLCALGLRVSELKAITVESLASGEASIRNKGKLRTILIPDALAKKLRAYCRERAITTGPVFVTRTGKTLDRSNVWKMLKRLADAARVLANTFKGWDKTIATVTGAATYTATYSSTVNKYTIKFVNDDGTVLQSSEYAYGATPSYTGQTPTKAATAQYSYTFKGWDKTIATVTGAATSTA